MALNEIYCVHCGTVGRYLRLNPWLSSVDHAIYECWCGGPSCDEGIAWYEANTVNTVAGRMVFSDKADDVRAQREALRCPTP